MSTRKKALVNTISIGALLATSITLQFSNHSGRALAVQRLAEVQETKEEVKTEPAEVEAKEPEVGSIQLSPGLYIPEEKTFRNQEVPREDVIKTMNLEAIKLAASSALAEIDAGVEIHLGYSEDDLNPVQLQLYEENVAHYSKLVQDAGQNSLEEQGVIDALNEFKDWASSYKKAIDASIEEEKQEQLAKEQEQEEEAKVIEEVDHSPTSTVSVTQQVSYGIPDLKEQYLTYEPYTAITAKTTPHYRLQTLAKTDKHGYRIYEDAVCVALASSYGTTIGTLYDIKFSDGKVMRAILGDNKADNHTDSLHQYRDATGAYDGKSGNIVEIIFDTTNYPTMQSVNKKINSDYSGDVVSIVKVGMAEGFGK